MDVTILNTNLDAVSIVDTYESFIWTDRYYAYGDFELYEAMREGLLDYIKQDYYLQSKESEHVMIVEKNTAQRECNFSVRQQSKNSKLYFQRINRSSNYKVETGSSVHGR